MFLLLDKDMYFLFFIFQEEKRMCVFYDKPDKARGNPESLKHSKVNLVWKENVASQRFEPRFPKDIG